MKIHVVGAGYVGLITAVTAARAGHKVSITDTQRIKIELLRAGKVFLKEPGVLEVLAPLIEQGLLNPVFLQSPQELDAIINAELIFIAVGTPADSAGSVDMQQVYGALEHIAPRVTGNQVIIIKSTIPPEKIITCEYLLPKNILFGVSPEFLRQGSALADFISPERVIIGARSQLVHQKLTQFYRTIIAQDIPVIYTNPETAMLIKYASNSYLALRVAFVNELETISSNLGCDTTQLLRGLGLDSRIGDRYLQPSIGFGGSCLPKDLQGLLTTAHTINAPVTVLPAVLISNSMRVNFILNQILSACEKYQNPVVAILGVAFKIGTDDTRSSSSIIIIRELISHNIIVRMHDPCALEQAARELPMVYAAHSVHDALMGAHVVAVLTPWPEYQQVIGYEAPLPAGYYIRDSQSE